MAADTVIRTYDPKNVNIAIGKVTLSGFAEDTFVTISRQGNAFETKRGADGTIARANTNAVDFLVKFTLLQTSPVNDALLAMLNSDMENNDGVTSLEIKELYTGGLKFEASAWIEKDPDGDWGNNVKEREWTIHTGSAKFTRI